MLWPMMFRHMAIVMRLSDLPTGGRFIRPSCGGSVASASAPKVSIIRFTHSNCTAVRGVEPKIRKGFELKVDNENYTLLNEKQNLKHKQR